MTQRPFASLLIANRGEIARRVMRTARRLGLRAVAVYSEADRDALHVREADAAIGIGGALPHQSYLNIEAVVAAALRSGAQAVHPGYGFLAENAAFAQAVLDAGLIWVGPSPAAIRAMGDKAEAKRLVHAAGVSVLRGYDDPDHSDPALLAAASRLGYPLMIKAAAGGGGRGMRRVEVESELAAALAQARSEAEYAFGDDRVLLERALETVRHVEVQVFGDEHGNCVQLGERDCSVQRRHQKLIEESPSPAVDDALRERLGRAAIAAARSVDYVGAGTVEFLLEPDGTFWFMEMNTRLQVEHPVTEMVTGVDLVEWQLRVAAGEPLPLRQEEIRFHGHAIEARVCAEDPAQGFLPQSGKLVLWMPPVMHQSEGALRIDDALESGAPILPFYDSMIAKVIAHGGERGEARERLAAALDATVALGVPTNKAFLSAVLRDPEFAACGATTEFVARRFARIDSGRPPAEAFALAGVLAAEIRARAAGYGEWTSWSNDPSRLMRARLGCGETVSDLAIRFFDARYDVAYRDGACTLRAVALDGPLARFVLETTSGSYHEAAVCAIEGDCLHLAWRGTSWRIEDRLREPPRRREQDLDGRVTAPINGRVVAVHAHAGERVEAGRPLVVLEAMKMEHALTLPAGVTVLAVHVAAGAQVAPGRLLVEFEADR